MKLATFEDIKSFEVSMNSINAPYQFKKEKHLLNNSKSGFKAQLWVYCQPVSPCYFIERETLIECILSNFGLEYMKSEVGKKWLKSESEKWNENPKINTIEKISIYAHF
eukprot:NODE_2_length_91304_cov_0.692462.p81 type:complete len:109 gc:universal NODE_2_length_91304_cov_0.692462:88607-88281(-)